MTPYGRRTFDATPEEGPQECFICGRTAIYKGDHRFFCAIHKKYAAKDAAAYTERRLIERDNNYRTFHLRHGITKAQASRRAMLGRGPLQPGNPSSSKHTFRARG